MASPQVARGGGGGKMGEPNLKMSSKARSPQPAIVTAIA